MWYLAAGLLAAAAVGVRLTDRQDQRVGVSGVLLALAAACVALA